jgi:hypothetical protein
MQSVIMIVYSFPLDGPYCGRGLRRKYGQKVAYQHILSTYL